MTQPAQEKPKTFEEIARTIVEPTAPPAVEVIDETDDDEDIPKEEVAAIPDWVQMPAGMIQPLGWQVYFLRFRSKWTNRPGLGDRHCVLWNLSEADEKLAAKRARGDANRIIDEMSKQMVRAFDGQRVDWTRGPASNIEKFWDEIGGKCRHLVRSYYLKTHVLEARDMADFFDSCVAVRTHTG